MTIQDLRRMLAASPPPPPHPAALGASEWPEAAHRYDLARREYAEAKADADRWPNDVTDERYRRALVELGDAAAVAQEWCIPGVVNPPGGWR